MCDKFGGCLNDGFVRVQRFRLTMNKVNLPALTMAAARGNTVGKIRMKIMYDRIELRVGSGYEGYEFWQ